MSASATAPVGMKSSSIWVKAWDFWALGLPLLAMAPMLVLQWQGLMSRPERQFFPVLVVVALFFPLRTLLRDHRQRAEHAVPVWRLSVAVVALQMALLCYGLSVWGFSPWLAHVAAIGVFFAWALGRCPDTPWSSVLAWTGLLVVTLPLPLNYDAHLITALQSSSSWACSMALDALQVPHLRMANVIEMRDRQFFIEEACSGIGSMYALLAAAALLVLVHRRSWLVALLTLLSVPAWAMLGNFLRLLAVTLGEHYYQRDLSHGTDHELLGVVTFGTAALGLWATEWILAGCLQPVPPTDDDFGFLFRTVNRLLCWPHPDPFAHGLLLEHDTAWEQTQREAELAARQAQVPRLRPWDVKPVRWALCAGAVVALVLGTAPTIVLARGSAADIFAFALPEFGAADLKKFPGAETMPERLGNWKRVGYFAQERSSASLFGAHSLIWEYARGENRFLLSLDFPFRGPHPLEYCYKGSGWIIDDVASMAAGDDKQWEWREVSMSNDFGAKGLVYYTALTEDGQAYSISHAERISGRFNRRIGQVFLSREPAYQPVCYQVQILYQGGTQLIASERSELRETFLSARKQLLAHIRNAQSAPGQ